VPVDIGESLSGEGFRAALGRLLHRRPGSGPPTSAELAELTGCTLDVARAALAEVLRDAEGYADATGADWPPPAWADTPAEPAPRPVEPAAAFAAKDLRTPAAHPEAFAVSPSRTPAAQPAAQPADPAPVGLVEPAAFAPSHSQPAPPAPPAPWPGLPCPPAPQPPAPAELRALAADLVAAMPDATADELAAELAFQAGAGSGAASDAIAKARDRLGLDPATVAAFAWTGMAFLGDLAIIGAVG